MKICIFPNDPIQAYVKKGEIKSNYFNPENFFSEVFIINPSEEKVNEELVKSLMGNSKFVIHSIGKINLFNLYKKKNEIVELVRKIQPDVIRSYNPLLQGWLASYCKKKLGIPYILSIHGHYQKDITNEYKKNNSSMKYFKLLLTRWWTEKKSISSADYVICIHNHLVPYAKSKGAKKVEVIFNKINLEQFKHGKPALKSVKPVILNVANFRDIKNQEVLIKAIKDLDVCLVLIGTGSTLPSMKKLVKYLNIENKVVFIESIPNTQIQDYFASAKIYAVPSKGRGFPIPVLEALASGCTVVMAKRTAGITEPIDPAVVYVENNPEDFKRIFNDVLKNPSKYKEKTRIGTEIVNKMDSKMIEKKEVGLYKKVIKFQIS